MKYCPIRKSQSSLQFKVYTSIDDLPDHWDDTVSRHNPLHSKHIGVTEYAQTPDIKNYYVEGYNLGNKLVFQAYCQQLAVQKKHFNLKGNRFIKWLITQVICIQKPKLLVAGNLFRHDIHTLQFHKKRLSALDQSKLLDEAIEYMLAYTKSHSVFLKDVPKQIAKHFNTKKEYQRMDSDIAMHLDIPTHWQSFDDYQNDLKRKYRNRAKSTRKKFTSVETRTLTLDEIIKYKKEMYTLYKQVTLNQVVSMGELGENYIEELKKSLEEKYQVTGFFIADKMIAFSSAIIHDGVHDMNYIGFDYSLNQQYSLYFNILFHCVECAIYNRCHKLLLGRTALEAKAIIGCEPDYLYTFYKLKNRFLNAVVKNISRRFENRLGEGWENRHPFKAEYYERK